MARFTVRKSLDATAEGGGNGLSNTLDPFSRIGLGIGCSIGTVPDPGVSWVPLFGTGLSLLLMPGLPLDTCD